MYGRAVRTCTAAACSGAGRSEGYGRSCDRVQVLQWQSEQGDTWMVSASLGCGMRVALELRFAASFRALTGCTRARSVTSLSKHSWQMTVSALGRHHGHARSAGLSQIQHSSPPPGTDISRAKKKFNVFCTNTGTPPREETKSGSDLNTRIPRSDRSSSQTLSAVHLRVCS